MKYNYMVLSFNNWLEGVGNKEDMKLSTSLSFCLQSTNPTALLTEDNSERDK